MKYEWRKKEKEFYFPSLTPEIKTIPAAKFIYLEGEGNPNTPEFSSKIEALYTASYALRMMPKNGVTPKGYFEYTVYPLEGLWDFKADISPDTPFSKDNFVYKIMIKQPDFVTDEVFATAKEKSAKKKPENENIENLRLISLAEEKTVQIMHLGSFDSESESFDKIYAFMEENGIKRIGTNHREVYLTDYRKVAQEKLKTVLRVFI